MVRRVATQVHKQVARLVRSNYLDKEPLWYKAVLEHPPIPLPPRAPPNRFPPEGQPYDLPTRHADAFGKAKKHAKTKTSPIVYLEDEVRRQFFRDHPFEAFRERSLVESGLLEDEHPIRGAAWTRLSQRGRNPAPEDCIRFAVNLYEHNALSLSNAYAAAVKQFRALRSEYHIASSVAAAEAEAYGTVFKPTEVEKGFQREQEYLKTWEQRQYTEQESMEARKRWKMIVERAGHTSTWTRGEEYVRLWKEGIRPDYSPALSAPVETMAEVEPTDFLGITTQAKLQ